MTLDEIREELKEALNKAKIQLEKLDSTQQKEELCEEITILLESEQLTTAEVDYRPLYESYYDSGC